MQGFARGTFHYTLHITHYTLHITQNNHHGGKSDRGPDHGYRRIVSLVTNRRLHAILHSIGNDIVTTPAFILTHFVANRL
jgi:hypothetical protein